MVTGTVRKQQLLVASVGVLLGSAAWLLAAGTTPPPAPTLGAGGGIALIEPQADADVRGFVAACELAEANEIPRLRELADSEDALVAGRAIAALGRLGVLHDDPQLLEHLADSRPRVRHETIIALGPSGDRHMVPLLIPILEDEDLQAQLLAITSLGQLGATDALNELIETPGTDPTVKAFAQGALNPISVPRLLATTGGLQ